jgi:hypothetical protein
MRTTKSATFRKLYARFDGDSLEADVHVDLTCNFSYEWFRGQRKVVIMRMGRFGGKNMLLGLLNLGLFLLCAIFTVIFKIQCCSCVKDDERPHSIPGHAPVDRNKAQSGANARKRKHDESEEVGFANAGAVV